MAEVLTDGDHGFIGVNSRMDPSQLPAGLCSFAKNMRFDRGVARPRKGIRKVPWLNRYETVAADPTKVQPLGKPLAVAMYRDPDQIQGEWVIICTTYGVWRAKLGATAAELSLPAGTREELATLSATDVNLIQCFGTMILQRGSSLETLVMTDLNEGFKSIGDVTLAGSQIKIPDSNNAAFIGNRLFIPHGDDLIFPSDLLDYTKGTILTDFKINQGSNDKLVGIFKFNDTTLIAGKRRSIYVVSNLYGDLSDARLDQLTGEYGLAGPKAFAAVGSDVWFLARGRGVVSIRQTSDNKLQGVDLPVSDPIQDIIKRINWNYAESAVATFHDNKFYLAVPLDTPTRTGNAPWNYLGLINGGTQTQYYRVQAGRVYTVVTGADYTSLINGTTTVTDTGTLTITAESDLIRIVGASPGTLGTIVEADYEGFNNAVLVYDTINGQWSGYDQADALMPVEWVKFPYAEQEKLGFLAFDGFMNLYEDGYQDQNGVPEGTVTTVPVATDFITRGYLNDPGARTHFNRATVTLSTWNPSYSLSLMTDGVSEETSIASGVTRSRTVYDRPWNAAAWVATNTNDDFLTEHRQDYSVALGNGESMDAKSGMNPSLHQEFEDDRLVRQRGRYGRIRVQGSQGRVEVRTAGVRGRRDNQGHGVFS